MTDNKYQFPRGPIILMSGAMFLAGGLFSFFCSGLEAFGIFTAVLGIIVFLSTKFTDCVLAARRRNWEEMVQRRPMIRRRSSRKRSSRKRPIKKVPKPQRTESYRRSNWLQY